MVIKKFKGKSHNEALAKAKREMGNDITLLHTRTLNKLMGSKIEVTVTTEPPKRLRGRSKPLESRPDPTFKARQKLLTEYARQTLEQARINKDNSAKSDYLSGKPNLQQLEKLQMRNKINNQLAQAPQSKLEDIIDRTSKTTPIKHKSPTVKSKPTENNIVQDDVIEMKKMLKELIAMQRKDRFADIPDELSEFYVKLIEQEVVEDLAHGLVKRLVREVGKDYLHDKDLLREKLLNNIAKLINVGSPITLKKGQTKVIAMVGPTGVGKTTSIAKIAANLQLKQKAKVGLITLDTFRISAVDQLHNYASILDVPIIVVNRAEEIQEAIIQLSACDIILIDTAGRSPRDYDKMSDLAKFLKLAKPDEVHLVLSTTTNQKAMERIIDSFSYCHIDRILLTKLDEAVNLGMVLNVLGRVQTELSYFTTGQNVPDDIEEGEARTLARMILA